MTSAWAPSASQDGMASHALLTMGSTAGDERVATDDGHVGWRAREPGLLPPCPLPFFEVRLDVEPKCNVPGNHQ